MSDTPNDNGIGQGVDDWLKGVLQNIPPDLETGLNPLQVGLLMEIANDPVTVTVEGYPVPHIHAALSALLYVMADYPQEWPQFAQMLDAANGLTSLLDDLHPGAGAAYQVMAAYYRKHAREDVE